MKISWGTHKDIVYNAASLIATTGLTSLLGFAYWNVAAKLFSQQAVGYGAAAVSVMTLLSSIGVFGLSTLLIGSLPTRTSDRAGLVWAATFAAAAGSLILTLGFIFAAPHFTTHFHGLIGSVPHAALLCAGVVLTTVTVVFDSASIGVLRGGLQLARNMVFSAVKLVTLIAMATVMHYALGIGLFLSWVAAIPVSMLVVAGRLWLSHERVLARPDWAVLKSLGKTVAAHNWLNLAISIPGLILPVLVASILSPADNAGFYAAWTIVHLLYVVPGHVSTALFAVASGDLQAMAKKLRFSLRISLVLGIPGTAVLALGARTILDIYGAGYSHVATVPMQLLVIGYLPALPGFFYVAVSRAAGKLSRAAIVMAAFGGVNVVASVIGCQRDGLVGMTLAGLLVTVAEALVTTPAVVRAALAHGKHRRPVDVSDAIAASALNGHAHPPTDALNGHAHPPAGVAASGDYVSHQEQQEAGMAVLLAMSTPLPPDQAGWGHLGPPPSPSRPTAHNGNRVVPAEHAPATRTADSRDRHVDQPALEYQRQDQRGGLQPRQSHKAQSLPRR